MIQQMLSRFLSTISFLLVFSGITYVFLSHHYMGIARDLAYRESFLQEGLFAFMNPKYLFVFWLIFTVLIFFQTLRKKLYTFERVFNLFCFGCLGVSALMYEAGEFDVLMLFFILQLFGLLRLALALQGFLAQK